MTVNSISQEEQPINISLEERYEGTLQKITNYKEEISEKDMIIALQLLEIKRLRSMNVNQIELSKALTRELKIIEDLYDKIIASAKQEGE